jgi:hypothetical protein
MEALWFALELERPIKSADLFDDIAARLHRHPRFRGMTIGAIDLILADLKRDLDHDLSTFSWRLVQAFKTEIGFDEDVAA